MSPVVTTCELENRYWSHAVHSLLPAAEKKPKAQSAHSILLSLYFPAGHITHVDACVSMYPDGHKIMHETAPTSVLPTHSLHGRLSVIALYFPATHIVHVDAVNVNPGRHLHDDTSEDPCKEMEFAGQL